MREILFRGKRADNGKWVYGGYHKWETRQPCPVGNDELKSDEIKHVIVINSFADWNMPRGMQACEVIPETLGQYTGLVGKNGTKIFEGDILKDDWGKIYKVIFTVKSCSFMVECMITPNEYEKGRYRIGEEWCDTLAVIGNIHDNPELLEVE